MPKSTPTRQLVALAVAAEMLGVSSKTVRRRVADGQLRAYRVGKGRALRVTVADVEALLEPLPTLGGAA